MNMEGHETQMTEQEQPQQLRYSIATGVDNGREWVEVNGRRWRPAGDNLEVNGWLYVGPTDGVPPNHVPSVLPHRLRPGVTACIVAHPARFGHSLPDSPPGAGKLARALQSVMRQTLQPDAIVVVNDTEREGAGPMRQRALDMVDTEWLAWLDSDDEWYPEHLAKLVEAAETTEAVFVFPWFDFDGGFDPLGHFGLPFDPASPHHTTITYLVRTELARRVGFSNDHIHGIYSNEDWGHLLGLCAIAVREELLMLHLAERTWAWHADGYNTCGRPGQGDAA